MKLNNYFVLIECDANNVEIEVVGMCLQSPMRVKLIKE